MGADTNDAGSLRQLTNWGNILSMAVASSCQQLARASPGGDCSRTGCVGSNRQTSLPSDPEAPAAAGGLSAKIPIPNVDERVSKKGSVKRPELDPTFVALVVCDPQLRRSPAFAGIAHRLAPLVNQYVLYAD